MTTNIQYKRYIVITDNEHTSYSSELGKEALKYATLTAKSYNGEIFTENGDGVLTPFKSYKNHHRKRN